jgi:hypothetical protein
MTAAPGHTVPPLISSGTHTDEYNYLKTIVNNITTITDKTQDNDDLPDLKDLSLKVKDRN